MRPSARSPGGVPCPVLRWLPVIALVVAASCKTADEKQCDAMFDRYVRCTSATLSRSMRASADEFCYITLGNELQAGDTTSFAATMQRALEECSAITDCAQLGACFEKHSCQWRMAGPGAVPQFGCWN